MSRTNIACATSGGFSIEKLWSILAMTKVCQKRSRAAPETPDAPQTRGASELRDRDSNPWAADHAIPVLEPNMAPVQAQRPIAHPAESAGIRPNQYTTGPRLAR